MLEVTLDNETILREMSKLWPAIHAPLAAILVPLSITEADASVSQAFAYIIGSEEMIARRTA